VNRHNFSAHPPIDCCISLTVCLYLSDYVTNSIEHKNYLADGRPETVDDIYLAHDGIPCFALKNTLMVLLIPTNVIHSLLPTICKAHFINILPAASKMLLILIKK
jgi:hypothetical protein